MRKVTIFILLIILFSILYTGYLYLDGMSNVSSFKGNLSSEAPVFINKNKKDIIEKTFQMAKSYGFILTKEDIEVKKGIANRGTYISETFLKSAFPNQKSKYIEIIVHFNIPMFLFTKKEKIKVKYAKPIIESPHKKEIDKEMKNLPILGK